MSKREGPAPSPLQFVKFNVIDPARIERLRDMEETLRSQNATTVTGQV